MKYRLTALFAVAAMVAAPAVASAAYIRDPAMTGGPATPISHTMSIVPNNGDAAETLASADITYFTSLCPTVLAHPADHSAMLDRFCQQSHG